MRSRFLTLAPLAAACTAGVFVPDHTDVDSDSDALVICDTPGVICTIAGVPGRLGYNGDGGWALDTWLYYPSSIVWRGDTMIVDDFNNMRIRELRGEDLFTVAGNGIHGWAVPDAPALESPLENPVDLAVDAEGNLFVAELHTNRVLRIEDDVVRIHAGTGDQGLGGDDGPATSATFKSISGVAVGPDGSVYVSDTDNHCIRVVGPDGNVRRLAGDGLPGFADGFASRLWLPQRVRVDGDRLLVADAGNDRVRAIDLSTGAVSTILGTGVPGSDGDGGLATEATTCQPYGVVGDGQGNVWVAEFGRGDPACGHRVRHIGPDGIVRTVAGTGVAGFSGDGGLAADAQLNAPVDVSIGPDGALYVADMFNGLVRRIAP